MPSRPPKVWFRNCASDVAASGSAYDPGAVCGAVWQRKSPAEQRATIALYEDKPMRSKHHAVSTVRHAASEAASELAHHGMPHAAHGVRIIGNATAAIGTKVRGWQSHMDGMLRGAPIGRRKKRRRKAGSHKGKRRRLTPAQKAAGFGGKRAMHGRKAARKRKGRKGGHRRRRR